MPIPRARADAPTGGPRPPRRKLEHLERRLRRSAAGTRLADVIAAHVEEAIYLVNHNRRVTIAWQRNGGPAFVRAIVDSGFDDETTVPRAVNGVTLEALLLAMADALQRHGSAPLRQAIAEQSLDLLTWARECDSLQGLFARLEQRDLEARR